MRSLDGGGLVHPKSRCNFTPPSEVYTYSAIGGVRIHSETRCILTPRFEVSESFSAGTGAELSFDGAQDEPSEVVILGVERRQVGGGVKGRLQLRGKFQPAGPTQPGVVGSVRLAGESCGRSSDRDGDRVMVARVVVVASTPRTQGEKI